MKKPCTGVQERFNSSRRVYNLHSLGGGIFISRRLNMSIWSMENGTFVDEFDSLDMAVSMGVPVKDLYLVVGDESGFEVTSVQSWTTQLV